MASNSRAGSIDLRSRNVPLRPTGDVSNPAGDSRQNTPATQPSDHDANPDIRGNSDNTVGGNNDRRSVAPDHPPPAGEDPRFAGLTQVQRYRLLELDAEKQLVVEKLKLTEMQNVRGHRREHSDDHYRDSSRKKASVIKVPDTQHLNNYNSTVMFL
ncbi:hypothetical protein HO173_013086 [Letharia columbiana]|uniref:Uncharacterized protein n=1 Tax=Letharia columbiana TaxID=112416 RepID=A0A8H6CIK7_9LECA|nr:uncharacterized protein HO173_013086 [Letharia columbiana]KAF6223884.1 hypothetical protein HO173_013086 [Letharia columbiana]